MQSYEGKYTERPYLAETLEQTPRCGGEVVQKAPGVIVSAIMTLYLVFPVCLRGTECEDRW